MKLSGDFNLHERLLRQRNRHIRLTRGSVLLLVTAAVCWLVGLGFVMHLSVSLLAGLIGLAWPVQGSRSWAFGYINQQSGLAYETALAMDRQPRDTFGLRSGVRARARARIAGMDQPRFSEWWLAALILSLAIILLPALQLSPPWSSGPAATPPPASQPAAGADSSEDETPEEEPVAEDEPQPLLEEEEDVLAQPAQQPGDIVEPGSPASADAPGAEREGEVLDRFLDNLRERPREPEPAAEVPGSPVPADADEAESSDDDQESDAAAPFDEEADDAAESDSESQTGADSAADQADGDEQEELADEEGAEQPAESAEPAGDGEEGGDAPTADDDAPEDGIQGLSEGDENGDSAGAGPGTPVPADEQERPGAAGEEEFLEGDLRGDEINIGGDVRLPGFSEVELPPDSSPASLGEAVERSLTGGNVPLEYQEIIRSYFR